MLGNWSRVLKRASITTARTLHSFCFSKYHVAVMEGTGGGQVEEGTHKQVPFQHRKTSHRAPSFSWHEGQANQLPWPLASVFLPGTWARPRLLLTRGSLRSQCMKPFWKPVQSRQSSSRRLSSMMAGVCTQCSARCHLGFATKPL